MRWVEGVESLSSQDSFLRLGPHKLKDDYNRRGSFQGKRVQAPCQAPHPKVPELWIWAPRTFCFEGQWGLLLGEPEDWEIGVLLLKGTYEMSQALRPKAEGILWKEPRSDLLDDLGEPPREAGDNWDTLWTLVAVIFGNSYYHDNTGINVAKMLARNILELFL